jgi:probable DNA metabolism protein
MRLLRFSGRFADWRKECRKLLEDGVAPHTLTWQVDSACDDLFAAVGEEPARYAATRAAPKVPRELPELLESAARFRADDRWALLYRVLWRVTGGDRSAMLAGDIDGAALQRRVKAVRREAHHMHAFLRFRQRDAALGAPQFVAWHEPAHDVLDLGAEHFAERMGRSTWLIATPDGAAHFDGTRVHYQQDCPAELRAFAEGIRDDGERLWQAYYASTFNPARLNEKVMRGHMPTRFWKNLPEGPLIAELMSQARAGQQRLAQTAAVGEQDGRQVLIAREKAQPQRPLPSSLDSCRNCDIWREATRAVPGEGPPRARIMLIGEQPGDQEDLAGKPFIGPAGQVLARALAEAGLQRADIYLTNAVKHFKWEPRGGIAGRAATRLHATPKPAEIKACRGWLGKELDEVQPQVIVALGRTALASLLEIHDPQRIRLADFAGKPFVHQGRWVLVAPHPAAVLRAGDGGEQRFAELAEALRQASERQEAIAT